MQHYGKGALKDFGLAALLSITLKSVELCLYFCIAGVDAHSLANRGNDQAPNP